MSTASSARRPDRSPPVRVLKFGGTSVGEPDSLRKAVAIVQEAATECRPVVVVSAAVGVTDDLVRAADETRGDRATVDVWTRDIGRRYRTLAREVLGEGPACSQYDTVLQAELSELRRALQRSTGPDAAAARDAVLATGERLMAPLFAAVMSTTNGDARPVDAAKLIHTDDTHGDATVKWDATQEQIDTWFQTQCSDPDVPIPVVTGFIGGTADGVTTTLGRGGSDLSAAIIAGALRADRLERWTDVEGLYTRDPAIHENARPIDELDFEQARTWTKAGRLGMHPRTLEPLASASIPVHVRCTDRPGGDATRIVPAVSPHER